MCEVAEDIFLKNHILVSDEASIITDMLKGYVKCNPDLAIFDFGNVIVRREHLQMDKVKILSSTASGHEPSFAGFVGQGFLTASIQGEIYCTPSPEVILNTIIELNRRNMHGILIIIGNSFSNRINFGLAIEKAKKIPNCQIKIIYVQDETRGSLENNSSVGTILVQKIACAMAEMGFFLGEIYQFCQSVINDIMTTSVVTESAQNPWAKINTAINPISRKTMSFGAGSHGQPGYLKMPLQSIREIVRIMLEQIRFPSTVDITSDAKEEEPTESPKNKGEKHKNKTDKAKSKGDKSKSKGKKSKESKSAKGNENDKESKEEEKIDAIPVVLIINNLGNTSKLEEQMFLQEVILQMQQNKITIAKVLCGTFMTSLRMSGFTITIMKLYNPKVLEYLSYPCVNQIWREHVPLLPNVDLYISSALKPHEYKLKEKRGPALSAKDEKIIKTAISCACEAITMNEQSLNNLDADTNNTKTGTDLRKIAAFIINTLNMSKDPNYPYELFKECAETILKNNPHRPIILYLYCIMLQKAANSFMSKSKDYLIDHKVWLEIMKNSAYVVQRYGKMKFGRNTMYDPLSVCANQFEASLNMGLSPLDAFETGVQAAETNAQLDPLCVDPAAYGVAIWLRGAYNGIKQAMKEIKEKSRKT